MSQKFKIGHLKSVQKDRQILKNLIHHRPPNLKNCTPKKNIKIQKQAPLRPENTKIS